MFVILVTYKKSLDIIDQYLNEHITFLNEGYRNNYFIVSGRRNPRIGGVIISQLNDRNQLEEFIKKDPFYTHELADYELIEFTPRGHHPKFAPLLTQELT